MLLIKGNHASLFTIHCPWILKFAQSVRCESDFRSRGHEFDPGPVPYFRGDWSWNKFYGHSPPFRWIIQEGCLPVTSESMCTKEKHRKEWFVCYLVILHPVDLILSPHFQTWYPPYRVCYTYINIISMDAGFYSILPSKVKISLFLFKWTANYGSFFV